MKFQKVANLLFMLVFLGFLFVGAAATVLRPKAATSFYENRALAAVPAASRASLISGSWFSGWETYLKDHAAGRDSLLKLSTYLDLHVIRRPVVNDIVIAGDRLLSFNNYSQVDSAAIARQSAKMTDSLKALDTLIRQNGGTFLYVAVPMQSDYFSSSYPAYLQSRVEYSNGARAQFKADMAARGIPFVDMGNSFDAAGHPSGYYSATDHHFTFDGAFKTYETILDRLNTVINPPLPVLSDDDFTVTTLPNPFLGSRGRKVFNMIPTSEKVKIAVLNRDIPFTRTDDGKDRPGTVYSLPQNQWDPVTYSVYMGGDVGETIIKTNRPTLPNALFVGDSYTNAVECFTYTSFNEMRSLDLRSYNAKTLADYIKEYKPGAVILLRDYSVLLSFDGNGKVS